MVTAAMKLRCLLLERKAITNLDSVLKSRDITANKGPYSQSYGFSSSHVEMWELDHNNWALKNWYSWTVVLKKTLESPLDCKEIKPVSPKGNQPWIFIGRTAAEAEAPILWPPDANSWLPGEDSDAGKDWRQKEKGRQKMRWLDSIDWLNGYEFEQTLGDSGGQRSLVCGSPWGSQRVEHNLATEQS